MSKTELPEFQIDDKSVKDQKPVKADPADGLRGEWLKPPGDCTGGGIIEGIDHKLPSEIIISGTPGESALLPGRAQLNVLKDGSVEIGSTRPIAKSVGPHDFITVSPSGGVSMSSNYAESNFSVTVNGDRQTISMPNGDQVVVQGGRIVEATTGGRRTEVLTPQEAKIREQERAERWERERMEKLNATASSIADSVRNGNIPLADIRDAYQMVKLLGSSPEELTKMINNSLSANGTEKTPYHVSADRNIKTGELRVTIQNRSTGDFTNIGIPAPPPKDKSIKVYP